MRAVDLHLLQELIRLHRLGLGGRAVAKRLGMSPTTERKYRMPLAAAGLLEGDAAELPELAHLKALVVAAYGEQSSATRSSSLEDLRERQPGELQAWRTSVTCCSSSRGWRVTVFKARKVLDELLADSKSSPEKRKCSSVEPAS